MRYKLEAGTKLGRIKWVIGVSNKTLMDNAPRKTGYNTEMHGLERLARVEVGNNEPYYPWQNKYEIVIKIIEGKAKRRRVQSNITKRVWDCGMVYEADIYSRTLDKDGSPHLENLTGDTIYLSEWLGL